jgi:hypothetical protein
LFLVYSISYQYVPFQLCQVSPFLTGSVTCLQYTTRNYFPQNSSPYVTRSELRDLPPVVCCLIFFPRKTIRKRYFTLAKSSSGFFVVKINDFCGEKEIPRGHSRRVVLRRFSSYHNDRGSGLATTFRGESPQFRRLCSQRETFYFPLEPLL